MRFYTWKRSYLFSLFTLSLRVKVKLVLPIRNSKAFYRKFHRINWGKTNWTAEFEKMSLNIRSLDCFSFRYHKNKIPCCCSQCVINIFYFCIHYAHRHAISRYFHWHSTHTIYIFRFFVLWMESSYNMIGSVQQVNTNSIGTVKKWKKNINKSRIKCWKE